MHALLHRRWSSHSSPPTSEAIDSYQTVAGEDDHPYCEQEETQEQTEDRQEEKKEERETREQRIRERKEEEEKTQAYLQTNSNDEQ